MFVVAVHPRGSRIESVVLGRLLQYWYVSVTVSRGGFIYPEVGLGQVNLLLDCGTAAGWISNGNVDGSKSGWVSWIGFDEEASIFTWEEVGVLGFTDPIVDS